MLINKIQKNSYRGMEEVKRKLGILTFGGWGF